MKQPLIRQLHIYFFMYICESECVYMRQEVHTGEHVKTHTSLSVQKNNQMHLELWDQTGFKGEDGMKDKQRDTQRGGEGISGWDKERKRKKWNAAANGLHFTKVHAGSMWEYSVFSYTRHIYCTSLISFCPHFLALILWCFLYFFACHFEVMLIWNFGNSERLVNLLKNKK